MKVKELIDELSKMDLEADVYLNLQDLYGNLIEITENEGFITLR